MRTHAARCEQAKLSKAQNLAGCHQWHLITCGRLQFYPRLSCVSPSQKKAAEGLLTSNFDQNEVFTTFKHVAVLVIWFLLKKWTAVSTISTLGWFCNLICTLPLFQKCLTYLPFLCSEILRKKATFYLKELSNFWQLASEWFRITVHNDIFFCLGGDCPDNVIVGRNTFDGFIFQKQTFDCVFIKSVRCTISSVVRLFGVECI